MFETFSFFLKKPGGQKHAKLWQADEHTLCHILSTPISEAQESTLQIVVYWGGERKTVKCKFLLFHCVAQVSEKISHRHVIESCPSERKEHETEFKVCSQICFSKHNVWITHMAVQIEIEEFIY